MMYDHVLNEIYRILSWYPYPANPLTTKELKEILEALGVGGFTTRQIRYIICKDRDNIIRKQKIRRRNYYYYDPLEWHIRNGM